MAGAHPITAGMLTVLSVAYPFAPVSLDTSGGAEQILAMLDRELTRRGHRSLVIAREGSATQGELIGVPVRDSSLNDSIQQETHDVWARAVAKTVQRERIDIVHMHGHDFHEYLPPAGPPALATLHLPPSFYPESAFYPKRARTWLNCVSETQRCSFPETPSMVAVTPNGIPLDLLTPADDGGEPSRRSALALGRICPEKGLHLAVEAALLAGMPLDVAGHLFPWAEHQRYFHEVLLPSIQPPNRFLGAVGLAEKTTLMRNASCVLIPSLVAETSSLVAMESIAQGTPVVAFRSGALAETVEEGRTGFLVDDVKEMAFAIGRAGEIDPAVCRRRATERFDAGRMARDYLELYARLCAL